MDGKGAGKSVAGSLDAWLVRKKPTLQPSTQTDVTPSFNDINAERNTQREGSKNNNNNETGDNNNGEEELIRKRVVQSIATDAAKRRRIRKELAEDEMSPCPVLGRAHQRGADAGGDNNNDNPEEDDDGGLSPMTTPSVRRRGKIAAAGSPSSIREKAATPKRPAPKKRSRALAEEAATAERQPAVSSGRKAPKKKAISDRAPKNEDASSPNIACKSPKAPPRTLLLEGVKVVVTGVFDTMSREEMELLVKRLGGSVMSAVSGRTNILIYGSNLEDGRAVAEGNKYRKAAELREGAKRQTDIRLLSEAEFLAEYASAAQTRQSPTSLRSPTLPTITKEEKNTSTGGLRSLGASISGINATLWTEKWRPTEPSQIIGNGENVRKFKSWLEDWHSVCILGKTKVNARAVMMSGPPGVGKSTTARVVAESLGFQVLEFNASDNRGKAIVDVLADTSKGGQTITRFLDREGQKKVEDSAQVVYRTNTVIIMDEMDGMSAGDRGGAQALLKLIETTQMPVVCICNDRFNPKLRTLVSKCYDLRFSKPPKNIVAKRLAEIARKEGVFVELNAVELLCERVGNDLRQMLNTLQLMSKNLDVNVSFDAMRKSIGFGLKDMQVMANPFDITRTLLSRSEASKLSLNGRLDGYSADFDLMPLFMQENYISAVLGGAAHQTNARDLDTIASVAAGFTMADMLNVKIRKSGIWSLSSDIGLFSTLVPSCQTIQPLINSLEDPKAAAINSMALMDTYNLTKDHIIENIGSLKLKSEEKLYDKVDAGVKRALTVLYNQSSHSIRVAPLYTSLVKRGKGASQETEGGAEGAAPEKDPAAAEGGEGAEEEEVDYLDKLIIAKKKDKAARGKKATAKRAAGEPKAKASRKKKA